MYNRLFEVGVLGLVAILTASEAWADGIIEGRVSDHSGSVFFDGAMLSLSGGNLSSVAKNGGRFRFGRVPAGRYILRVSYIGASDVEQAITVVDEQTTVAAIKIGKDVTQIENVLVIGQAAGVLSAINQVRGADNLMSIVTADSIGQLPDENVSEALQRISGVFIERDQGEGRFVGIRGIDPQLNVATINGLNLPSPESNRRNVALDVIPSDLVESLEVTKTLTPNLDGDAIGGTINIKSLSAFDRDGMSYKLKGQLYKNELEDADGYKASGSFTNVFDAFGGELGVALSVSNNEREFGTDGIEADGGWSERGGVRFHENLEMRNFQITRERQGYALNVDYRRDENTSYYLRTLRSDFSDQEFRNRIEFKFDEDDIVFDATSLQENKVELERELKDRFERQKITSLLVGGENIAGDWTFEYSVGYSEAEENEPNRIDIEFENKKIGSAGYSSLGQVPTLTYSDDGLDGGNFKLKKIRLENNSTKDEETALRFDMQYDTDFAGNPGYIKVGGKFRSRDKSNDVNAQTFKDFDDAFGRNFLLSEFSTGNVDYTLGNYGPAINSNLVRAFVNTHNGSFIEDSDATLLDSARDFDMSEAVTALYIMSRVDIDNLRIVYGLRYEQTAFDAEGFNVVAVDVGGLDDTAIEATSFSSDYSNVLPSLNLRYAASDALILRAAYTQSIARPSFGDLNPTPNDIDIEEDGADIELKVKAGNPNLKPYESQNIDFALEYYPEKLGIFALGAFYKSIDNFIFQADVASTTLATEFAGAIPVTDIKEVLKPLNGNTADLYGIELGWTRHMDDLPSPFDGFLLQANATFTGSDADLGLSASAGRSSRSTLPQQAEKVANFVVGYEKHGFSLRLSSAYVSERIAEISLENTNNDLYEAAHHQVDFSAKYDVTDQFQVYMSAINLNEEPCYRFYGSSQFSGRYDEIGRSFVLGITYRNF